MEVAYYKSPIGTIEITSSDVGIKSLYFLEEVSETTQSSLFSDHSISQIEAYFNGDLSKFNLSLDLEGTEFQIKVWNELLSIPFGQTISYMDLAKRLGNPKSIRAVARANAKNPVSIIVPCHRVIGSDGSLTGYAGGLWRKKWLLEHEQLYHQMSVFE